MPSLRKQMAWRYRLVLHELLAVTVMTEYIPWRERFASPQVRRPNQFVAAADQVVRYGRQLSHIEWNIRWSAGRGDEVSEIHYHSAFQALWDSFDQFISQFPGALREVLTRTFWQAYNS